MYVSNGAGLGDGHSFNTDFVKNVAAPQATMRLPVNYIVSILPKPKTDVTTQGLLLWFHFFGNRSIEEQSR